MPLPGAGILPYVRLGLVGPTFAASRPISPPSKSQAIRLPGNKPAAWRIAAGMLVVPLLVKVVSFDFTVRIIPPVFLPVYLFSPPCLPASVSYFCFPALPSPTVLTEVDFTEWASVYRTWLARQADCRRWNLAPCTAAHCILHIRRGPDRPSEGRHRIATVLPSLASHNPAGGCWRGRWRGFRRWRRADCARADIAAPPWHVPS